MSDKPNTSHSTSNTTANPDAQPAPTLLGEESAKTEPLASLKPKDELPEPEGELLESVGELSESVSQLSAPADKLSSDADAAIREDKPDTNTSEDKPPHGDTTRTEPDKVAAAPAMRKKSKAPWLVGFVILLGWGATAAGGYWIYLQQQASEQDALNLSAQLGDMNTQVQQALAQSQGSVASELNQFKQSINTEIKAVTRETTSEINTLGAHIKEHEARLNGQQERLAGLTTTSREDWLLAEAEYLLKLANQRVLLERTPLNVVGLLTRADQIVERVSAGLGDRELFAIRKLLAEEIVALNRVDVVDTQGIYLKLSALASTVNHLSTLPSEQERFGGRATSGQPPEAPLAQVSSTQTAVSDTFMGEFKQEMSSLFDFIRSAFSWYSEEKLATPIISQQRLQLMQLNTRLLLEQAQIALLREDTTTYQESLKSASELAGQYYFESPTRKALVSEIEHLIDKNIAPELPDISQSLKLLHTYIATQHSLNTPSAGQISKNQLSKKEVQ